MVTTPKHVNRVHCRDKSGIRYYEGGWDALIYILWLVYQPVAFR